MSETLKAELYIGMQPDEDVAEATCGCTLYRTGDDAPTVAGTGFGNADPLLVMCPLHLAAEDLRVMLAALVHAPNPKTTQRARVLLAQLTQPVQF